ncbi:hypothetical protein D3C75_1024880 [compost metagenome]
MQLVKQDEKSITVELSPLQLLMLRDAMAKELSHRRRDWDRSTPEYPEELLYRAAAVDVAQESLYSINTYLKTYKQWGIVK